MAEKILVAGVTLDEEARKEVLEDALKEIKKRYGDGAVMRLGEAHHLEVEAIPTGSLSLDLALGVGGIPR
ncbi:MAG: DNA recombination/repair protein RecA, partial [Anaerolineales bacterium]